MTEQPPSELVNGRYRLERLLGRGAAGSIHLATDTRLGRRVAVKRLFRHLGTSAEFLARFEREAALLGRLDSPHVIPIYEHGRDAGTPYLVMQYAAGGDLGDAIRRYGPLPPDLAAEVCAQVADALDAAHRVGVVHRDVKPANVLLRDDRLDTPHVYLADFGVAFTEPTGLTRTGVVVGSWNYVSPERVGGDPGSPASDVYAVGCLLHEALTGRPPYAGTDIEIAMAHVEEAVPQLPGGGALVQRLNRVLARAMAKDPAQRYPSAAALRDDLSRLAPRRTGAAPRRSRRRGLTVAVAATVAVLVVGGLVAWRLAGDDGPTQAAGSPPTSASASASTSPTPAPVKRRPTAITGDLDGDGKGDLLTSEDQDGGVMYRSTGRGFADPERPKYVRTAACEGDFRGGSRVDVASIDAYDSPVVVTIRGLKRSTTKVYFDLPATATPNQDGLLCPDLDGNGRSDLVMWAISPNGSILVYAALQRSDGTWSQPKRWATIPIRTAPKYPEIVLYLLTADVNGDGRDDILSYGDDSAYSTWLSTGTGLRAVSGVITFPDDSLFTVADIDGDGTDELIEHPNQSPRVKLRIWTYDPKADAWHARSTSAGFIPGGADVISSVTAADVNGDHRDDLILLDDTVVKGVDAWVAVSTGQAFKHSRRWSTDVGDSGSAISRSTPQDWFG